jgi:beta-N-acetylhexosaminidase
MRLLAAIAGLLVVVSPRVAGPARAQPDPLEALIAQMSLADRVGQLFMLGFPGDDASAAVPLLGELRAGGIVLTANVTSADSARALTGALQSNAAANGLLPLLISVNH